ncbi:hypothetical protein K2Q08_03215, partial [Patescibacteria group bacterium]|nr:hypothetical protein [Patescibacteria group bacterium]
MPDFKKNNKFSGGSRGGGFSRGGDRPSYGGDRRGGGRDFGRPQAEMFAATCNNCNAACEVPFRPNGTKPVFCKNCFVRNDEQRSDGRSYEKRPFSEQRPSPMRAPSATSAADPRIGAMQKEMGEIHAKLDALVARLESAAYSTIITASPNRAEVSEKIEKKVVAKPEVKKAVA